MQPESSVNRGQLLIQKLNEARGMVTITQQRRHIFLVESKRTLNAVTSNEIRLSDLRPESFLLNWTHCLPGLRARVSA